MYLYNMYIGRRCYSSLLKVHCFCDDVVSNIANVDYMLFKYYSKDQRYKYSMRGHWKKWCLYQKKVLLSFTLEM